MNTEQNLLKLANFLQDSESRIISFLKSFTFDRRGKIITAGNGGSACEAAHLTEELLGKYEKTRAPINSLCLCSDAMVISCIANDFGYEHVFSRQVEAVAGPHDTLVLFTTSGNSKNILLAVKAASPIVKNIVVLNGKTGGACHWEIMNNPKAKEFIVGLDSSARIQEVHQFIMHELVEKAERELL